MSEHHQSAQPPLPSQQQPPAPVPRQASNQTDVLGILSIISSFVGLSAVGIVLGLVGASQAKQAGRPVTLSRVGWILSLVWTVLTCVGIVIGIVIAFVAPQWFSGLSPATGPSPTTQVAPDTRTVSVDGYSIAVPVAFKDLPEGSRAAGASYTQGDDATAEYVAVFKDSRSDFSKSMDVRGYADFINRNSYQRDTDINIVDPVVIPFTGVKNPLGYSTVDYKVTAEIDDISIVYYTRYLATDTSFYQIVTWTLPSKVATTEPTLVKILESFRETK